MRANRDLLAQSLSDRLPLRAAVSGRVLSVPISPLTDARSSRTTVLSRTERPRISRS